MRTLLGGHKGSGSDPDARESVCAEKLLMQQELQLGTWVGWVGTWGERRRCGGAEGCVREGGRRGGDGWMSPGYVQDGTWSRETSAERDNKCMLHKRDNNKESAETMPAIIQTPETQRRQRCSWGA